MEVTVKFPDEEVTGPAKVEEEVLVTERFGSVVLPRIVEMEEARREPPVRVKPFVEVREEAFTPPLKVEVLVSPKIVVVDVPPM